MTQESQHQRPDGNDDVVTEATPLLLRTTIDPLLSSVVVMADPDSYDGNGTTYSTTANYNDTIPSSSTTTTTTEGGNGSIHVVNGKRRRIPNRKQLRHKSTTTDHNNNHTENGMDTSDGSRESTTSSIHSHLQSFREVSLRLIQYVAHHSGTNL